MGGGWGGEVWVGVRRRGAGGEDAELGAGVPLGLLVNCSVGGSTLWAARLTAGRRGWWLQEGGGGCRRAQDHCGSRLAWTFQEERMPIDPATGEEEEDLSKIEWCGRSPFGACTVPISLS